MPEKKTNVRRNGVRKEPKYANKEAANRTSCTMQLDVTIESERQGREMRGGEEIATARDKRTPSSVNEENGSRTVV
jgi:hypothetical protein